MKARPHVFVVDGFDDERDMYAECLSVSGFDVHAFDTADVAFDTALRGAPDAVVTRIRQRPGSPDGIALAAKLRAEAATRNTTIVIITSSMWEGHRQEAERLRCDAYLVVPTDPEELARTIRAALRARARGRVAPRPARRHRPRRNEDIA